MKRGFASPDITITHRSIVTCLGHDWQAHVAALRSNKSGLSKDHDLELPFDCYVGQVSDLSALDFPAQVAQFDNRANRLALAAVQSRSFEQDVLRVRDTWGADRCGVVLGTSASGMHQLEQVYRTLPEGAAMPVTYNPDHHDSMQSVAAFLQQYLGLSGPSYTVSTACSSSAKSLIDAYHLIEAGLCDAVLTGGVDSLCLTSLAGFEALELISREPCKPCDVNRNGLSIGEAAALMIVERDASGGIRLLGYGESSDGTNMSTPPEDGAGAADAIRQALARSGLSAGDIDYVNLHGTATVVNDRSEARAIQSAVRRDVPASSLKGAVGHTLGAAGAVEALFCMMAIEDEFIPPNVGLQHLDPLALPNVSARARPAPVKHALSNSFGFGGNNCALVLGR